MDYQGVEANYIAGTPYLGARVKMYPRARRLSGRAGRLGSVHARKVWGVKEELFPVYSGVLATACDVVFYGTMDGWFKAVDARTGTELWKFHTSSGIVGNPMTYRGPDGKQYVAIYSGIGGWMGSVAFPTVSADDPEAATRCRWRDEGHQEIHGGRKYGVCLRSLGGWLRAHCSPRSRSRSRRRHCCVRGPRCRRRHT